MCNTRIFVSYNHHGEGPKWLAALRRSLHLFEQHHLLDVRQDGKIWVSSFLTTNARLAVLLLTQEALDSEYILNTEFPFLLAQRCGDGCPILHRLERRGRHPRLFFSSNAGTSWGGGARLL